MNLDRLYEPFDSVRTKPVFRRDRETGQLVKAGELSYITARQVMDRLDEVFGPLGWSATFLPIGENHMMCRLSVTVDGQTIIKEDIGYGAENAQSDSALKAAASDALKRAAVHLGIGRYLYEERDDRRNGDWSTGNRGGYPRKAVPVRQQGAKYVYAKAEPQAKRDSVPIRQKEAVPFGDEFEEVKNAMREAGVTATDFHHAFGVAMSEEVVLDMINDGLTPDEIVGQIIEQKSLQ